MIASPKDAEIHSVMVNEVLRAIYVDFAPDATSVRTLQAGSCEDGVMAFVDVDESGFPLALELRGWQRVEHIPSGTSQLTRDQVVKHLFMVAVAIIHGIDEEKSAISRASEFANQLAMA